MSGRCLRRDVRHSHRRSVPARWWFPASPGVVIGDYLAMPVHACRTGMRLRPGFPARTCFEPDILLMDEWMGVGGSAFFDEARGRLEAFADGVGISALAAQKRELPERVCPPAVLPETGRVRAAGPLGEVLDGC